ncbi:MAG: hypothetical protein V3V14_07485 [Saprospiraceae bacterium]
MKCPDYPNKLQDLNVLIRSSLKNCGIFNKTEHISLQEKLTPNLPKVRVNVDDISLAIGHLLINALDSMPNGGKINVVSTQGRGTAITLCLPAAFKSAKPRVAEKMH